MAILGLGIGLFYPTATTVGVTGCDESRRSLAGAIIYMFQIAGGSVGLGLTTTVFIGASDRAQSGSRLHRRDPDGLRHGRRDRRGRLPDRRLPDRRAARTCRTSIVRRWPATRRGGTVPSWLWPDASSEPPPPLMLALPPLPPQHG